METNSPRSKFPILVSILIILIILVAGAAWYLFTQTKVAVTSEYQAVFLNNGQVYFGKLAPSHRWLTLTDVYYLQTQTQSAASNGSTPPATTTPSDIKLVKLGSELHGPEDAMYLDPHNVLFWENLKSDSKVVQAIKQIK